jgi:hypothetical protein
MHLCETATQPRWTAPPDWPQVPAGWTPPLDWRPDTTWAPAPDGWAFWRCGETAADLAVDPRFRSPDLDARIRPYLTTATAPASAFVSFLEEIRGIGDAALHSPDAAGVIHSPARDRLLRRVSSAARILTRASSRGEPAPFVFFACVQDAMTAAAMFAAEPPALPTPAGLSLRQVREAQEKGQRLFDATIARIMAVFNRAVDDIGADRANTPTARLALRELDEVKRLVEAAGSRTSIPVRDLRQIIDALEACGRRAAATLGVPY